jgi:hypothetical protein
MEHNVVDFVALCDTPWTSGSFQLILFYFFQSWKKMDFNFEFFVLFNPQRKSKIRTPSSSCCKMI